MERATRYLGITREDRRRNDWVKTQTGVNSIYYLKELIDLNGNEQGT